MSAPDRIWLGRDTRYVGEPWIRLASEFDDEDEEICEYVRADIAADLLAALEMALDAWGTHCKSGDGMQGHWESDARAAIARARGAA